MSVILKAKLEDLWAIVMPIEVKESNSVDGFGRAGTCCCKCRGGLKLFWSLKDNVLNLRRSTKKFISYVL